MKHLYWQFTAGLLFIVPALAGEPGAAAETPPARLAFVASGKEYHFDTGVLRGTLRPEGKSLGLRPVLEGAAGTPIAGPYGLFSLYRMLTADARFGVAAWDWASESKLLPDGAVEVSWSADKEHPFDMTAVYRWTASNVLDLKTSVKPQQDLRRFELFLASYFDGFPACYAYVLGSPYVPPIVESEATVLPVPSCPESISGFQEAKKEHGYWQTFWRDHDDVEKIFGDGRWKRPPNPVEWKMMGVLAAPLALRRDAKSGLMAVLMSPREDCFAISMPFGEEAHRSVYLSLFGRDIKNGETASARARLVIGRGITGKQAIELYQAYVKK